MVFQNNKDLWIFGSTETICIQFTKIIFFKGRIHSQKSLGFKGLREWNDNKLDVCFMANQLHLEPVYNLKVNESGQLVIMLSMSRFETQSGSFGLIFTSYHEIRIKSNRRKMSCFGSVEPNQQFKILI